MNKKIHITALASAIALTTFSGAAFAQGMMGPGMAMSKAKESDTDREKTAILGETDKISVRDSYFEPGAVARMGKREGLISYHITPMTAERTFEDGTKQVINFKAGQLEVIKEKRPFSSKNIGKNRAHLLAIRAKEK